jgi:hypothetical protein
MEIQVMARLNRGKAGALGDRWRGMATPKVNRTVQFILFLPIFNLNWTQQFK